MLDIKARQCYTDGVVSEADDNDGAGQMQRTYDAHNERTEIKHGVETGRRIVNIRETIHGYRAELVQPGKAPSELHGSWAFTPGLSWWSASESKWIVIGGYWQ